MTTRTQAIFTIRDSIAPEFRHGQSVHGLAAVILFDRLDVRTAEQAASWADWALQEARRAIEDDMAGVG